MIVRFSGLKPGKYSYGFTLSDEFFKGYENEELTGGKVQVEAEMERLEHTLMFSFRIEGELTTWCDRCLGQLMVPIEGEEVLCVRFSDTEQSDDESVVVLPEGAFEIDLSQVLYEMVAVRLPMQHKHAEGECDEQVVRYIKSDEELAADEREVDPRWKVLEQLRGEMPNEKENKQ